MRPRSAPVVETGATVPPQRGAPHDSTNSTASVHTATWKKKKRARENEDTGEGGAAVRMPKRRRSDNVAVRRAEPLRRSMIDEVLQQKRALESSIARQRVRLKLNALLTVLPHNWMPNPGAVHTATWLRGNARVDGLRTVDADIAWLAAEVRMLSQVRRLPSGAGDAARAAVGVAQNSRMPDIVRTFRLPPSGISTSLGERQLANP